MSIRNLATTYTADGTVLVLELHSDGRYALRIGTTVNPNHQRHFLAPDAAEALMRGLERASDLIPAC